MIMIEGVAARWDTPLAGNERVALFRPLEAARRGWFPRGGGGGGGAPPPLYS